MPFLVFAGGYDECSGGWDNFLGKAPSLDEARRIARNFDKERLGNYIWWHIVDTEHWEIILQDHEDPGTASTAATIRASLADMEQKND